MPHIHALPDLATGQATAVTQPQSDDTLVKLIAGGDKDAMQTLFRRHNVSIYRFILRLVNDTSSAEDLTSEVFLEVWRQAGQFAGRSQVSTWLLSIARDKALSALPRRATEAPNEEAIDPSDTPEAAMERGQRNKSMRETLMQLTPAHREVIDLVYYHERSVAEVAAIVGIPQNTVQTRLFHARKRMAKLVGASFCSRQAASG